MVVDSVGLNHQSHSYSYQHIQGTMLLNLNKLTYTIKLAHSEYRLMAMLIGLWNKQKGMAFPTVEYLAKHCSMGKQTVIKSLNKLVELNLLIVAKTSGKRNNYYFSNLILTNKTNSSIKAIPKRSITCNTAHDIEQIKIKTNKNQTSFINKKRSLTTKNDDVFFKTTNINDYKEFLNKLNCWGFTGAKKLLQQKSTEKIKKLIEIVENHNPKNKGAYLRTLINTSNVINQLNIKTSLEGTQYSQIECMLKHQYWKHIPSSKIVKAKPDIGEHLLIKYYKQENMVMFLENGLIDKLENFETVEKN